MMALLLWLGLVPWLYVVWNFTAALAKRRSAVRIVFVAMSAGWPLWMLRELRVLPNGLTRPLVVVGICAGCWSALVLLNNWVNDPRSLE